MIWQALGVIGLILMVFAVGFFGAVAGIMANRRFMEENDLTLRNTNVTVVTPHKIEFVKE